MTTVYLVYYSTNEKTTLCCVCATEKAARDMAEGFVSPPRVWFNQVCVHVGGGNWETAHVEEWEVQNEFGDV